MAIVTLQNRQEMWQTGVGIVGWSSLPVSLLLEREAKRSHGGRGTTTAWPLPSVLLLLGGHIKAEVKLPAPPGVTGQGRHHPLAGGACRLEHPYCRHTSGQLLGEVTKRRSIHLSSGLTETRHVTRGGCLGLPGLKVCPLPP